MQARAPQTRKRITLIVMIYLVFQTALIMQPQISQRQAQHRAWQVALEIAETDQIGSRTLEKISKDPRVQITTSQKVRRLGLKEQQHLIKVCIRQQCAQAWSASILSLPANSAAKNKQTENKETEKR